MDVPLAVLADAANTTADGRLNILGTFNRINASQFPAVHPSCTLVIVFRARRSEQGQHVRASILFMDEDRSLAQLETEFTVPPPEGPGDVFVQQILQVRNLVLPHSGSYAFHILVNGTEQRTIDFLAAEAPESPPDAQ